ncbi:MAG TPA: class I SAM-dependent methyltransferase [Candidatus Binatus sp.]|nr:class I SAM-dependent methyltransferase [Candidatus Binatus sp.]
MQNSRKSKRVQEYYDKLSTGYIPLYSSEQAVKHAEAIQHLGEGSHPTILDIGCGDGTLMTKLVDFSRYQIGLDFSTGMLERAKSRLKSTADLVQAEAEHLPFKDGFADCSISVSVAENNNVAKIVAEALRVTTKSGMIIISVLHPGEAVSPELPKSGLVTRSQWSRKETVLVISR